MTGTRNLQPLCDLIDRGSIARFPDSQSTETPQSGKHSLTPIRSDNRLQALQNETSATLIETNDRYVQLFDPLHFVIGVGPLAVYLLLIGILNYSRKPFLTTGGRDASALSVAIAGLVIVGPMELFMPPAAADRFAGFVWLLLLMFYGLCVSLVILLMRPRLIIYNVTIDQLRPLLMKIVHEIDKESRWAGDSLTMPSLKIQLHVETSPLRHIQLVSSGPNQNLDGWQVLELKLAEALAPVRSVRNPVGLGMIIVAGLIGMTCTIWMLSSPESVAQSLSEMLRL